MARGYGNDQSIGKQQQLSILREQASRTVLSADLAWHTNQETTRRYASEESISDLSSPNEWGSESVGSTSCTVGTRGSVVAFRSGV